MLRLFVQSTIPDARATIKKQQFSALGLKLKLGAVRFVEVYTIDAKLNAKQIQKARELLANPLVESADTALVAPRNFNYAIEIGYLPGVTDNVGNTAKETLADGTKIKFKDGQKVYSSWIFFVSFTAPTTPSRSAGHPSLKRRGSSADIQKITNSLYNPLIQRATIKSRAEFIKNGGMDEIVPKVKLSASAKISKVNLEVSDEELTKLGKFGIPEPSKKLEIARRSAADDEAISDKKEVASSDALLAISEKRRGPLSLSLDYLKTIREHFRQLGRQPTDVEIETLGQTWSEHCKHTIFADPMDELKDGIYKSYIKKATETIRKQKGRSNFCVSVFTDNAGGIIFDKDFIITHKVETHNTPSALDPFGGAITGIVGVNRDCLGFGLGAKPVINTYGFCLADPEDKTELYRSNPVGNGRGRSLQSNKMLSAKRIMQGVISGINAGGNQSGIPTNSGFMYFDPRYRGKPLVFAGTVGLIPRMVNGQPSWKKQAKTGDLIVVVGGRVGADGIHGATFASEGLDSHSPATAVQIGDPITQKKFSDALIKEARDKNLFSSITDCGAGGLSSAVGEMAQATGGCLVNLDKVPLKYPGLSPWQIWISESQERMVLAVRPAKWKKLQTLLKKRSVETTVIGKFTDDGKCTIKFKNQTVLDLGLEFLHNGRPIHHQRTKKPAIPVGNGRDRSLPEKKAYSDIIIKLLSRLNIAGQDFLATQYDHEVQGGSTLKPLQGRGRINAESTVTRPVLTSAKGVVLSYGINPSYSELDPYNMAACAIDSAVRSAVAAGANVDYLALLDNFCWCSPEDPERLWQLQEAARACFDIATAYGTPFISGKDSMYNDFKGYDSEGNPRKISIPPTLLISAIGVIPDVTKTVSLEAKIAGDVIYILGNTDDEMGGSEYSLMVNKSVIPEATSASEELSGIQIRLASGSRVSAALAWDGSMRLVPSVNTKTNYRLYKTLFQAIQQNLVASSISIGRGGLAIALMKKLAGGGLGANINIAGLPGNWKENYQALFSESQGRILLTVAPQNTAKFEQMMSGQTVTKLGKTIAGPTITITNNNKQIVKLKTADVLKAYNSTFKDY